MPPRTILGVVAEAQSAPYSGDDLVAEAHHLNRVAYYGGIHAKLQAVSVLEGVANGIAIASRVLAGDLRAAGYGPALTDGVYAGATSLSGAAGQFGHAKDALESLLNMKVGDLAASGQQVPDQSELNGGR